jgi:hypothetical protein
MDVSRVTGICRRSSITGSPPKCTPFAYDTPTTLMTPRISYRRDLSRFLGTFTGSGPKVLSKDG